MREGIETETPVNYWDMEEHDCDFVSGCCGAYPVEGSLDTYLTGHCGSCHEGTGFECTFEDEYGNQCPMDTYYIMWTCIECNEYRYGDARVKSGLKCGHCAYDNVYY